MIALECCLSYGGQIRSLREIQICQTVVDERIITDSLEALRQFYRLDTFFSIVVVFAYIDISHVYCESIIAYACDRLAVRTLVRKHEVAVVDVFDLTGNRKACDRLSGFIICEVSGIPCSAAVRHFFICVKRLYIGLAVSYAVNPAARAPDVHVDNAAALLFVSAVRNFVHALVCNKCCSGNCFCALRHLYREEAVVCKSSVSYAERRCGRGGKGQCLEGVILERALADRRDRGRE